MDSGSKSDIVKDTSFQSAESEIRKRLLAKNELKRSHKQSIIEQMNFDHALEKVGAENWYQKRAFIIFALQWFIAANILLSGSFLFPSPKFINCPAEYDTDKKCQDYVCNNVPESQRSNYIEYPTNKDHFSATQEYDLICSRKTLATILQSSPYAGSFTGFLIFPMIADNKGRTLAWALSWGICTVGCIIMSCSFDYYSMLIGYFLAGFGANPAITLHYSFLNEHSLGKLREYTAIGVQVAFGLGELSMVGQIYLIHNWRWVCIIMLAIPSFLLNCGPLFVYESPKFLYEQSTEKAIELLNKIATVNGKEHIKYNALQSMVKDKEEKTYSVIDLFRFKSLRLTTYCACFVFFAIQAIYYGISFSMDQVGPGLYVNTLIIGSAELIAYCTTDLFIPKLRRKVTCMVGLGLGTIMSLCYLFIKGDSSGMKIVQIILAALFRFNIAFVWTVVYVFFSELFPTTVRSLALGFTSLAGTFGSIGAPFLINALEGIFNPMVALGAISFIAIFHVIPLKETLGQPLLQQIAELEIGGDDKLVIEYEEQIDDSCSETEEYENLKNKSKVSNNQDNP